MSKLTYGVSPSLDGYVVDAAGSFDWAAPDAEVHTYINDVMRPFATHLYGRRMYEVLSWWDDPANTSNEEPFIRDYGEIRRAADKVVYSRTLDTVTTGRTRLERNFDAGAVREMKASSAGDLLISGPTISAHALEAALVDEVILFVSPVAVGGGTAVFPSNRQIDLALLEEHRFTNGALYLRYAVKQ